MPTTSVALKEAATSLPRERCRVSPDVLDALNADGSLDEALAALQAGRGFQIRVRKDPGRYALYTVAGTLPPADKGTVRMSRAGLGRVEARPEALPVHAVADTRVVDLPPRDEFTEHLTRFGAGADLVVIAPHGGLVEEHTDAQADLVLSTLSRARIAGLGGAECWVCKGFSPGGGAAERWHITSTDISEHSFPKLKAITRANRGKVGTPLPT